MMTYVEKKFPNEASKAVAYKINFHNIVYGYSDQKRADFCDPLCTSCHRMVQNQNYMIPRKSLKKSYGRLPYFGFCISPECKNILIENFNDVSEADFREVVSKNNEIICYQLTPQNVMPPIYQYNNMEEFRCSTCNSIYWYPPIDETILYIDKDILNNLKTINFTYEHTPLGNGSIIVSKAAYDILTKNYCQMEFTPVLLI